jgi:hypothetical protein
MEGPDFKNGEGRLDARGQLEGIARMEIRWFLPALLLAGVAPSANVAGWPNILFCIADDASTAIDARAKVGVKDDLSERFMEFDDNGNTGGVY